MNAENRAQAQGPARASRGFTLIELLVVVALIAILTGFLLGGLPGGGRTVALQSAQATLANAVALARTQARASGRPVRLLVNVDPAKRSERFLRSLVLQRQDGGLWTTLAELRLPPSVYLVPGNFGAMPLGLFDANEAVAWHRTSDAGALRSTALRDGEVMALAVDGGESARWCGITFAAAGTTLQTGDLVLAAGRERTPGSFSAGESPVRLENAEAVRGLSLSAYGVVTLIDDRNGF